MAALLAQSTAARIDDESASLFMAFLNAVA
jgi:hypothetical protein